MLIRSQDKRRIVNLNDAEIYAATIIPKDKDIREKYETEIRTLYSVLGTYSSEDKAIKVLDMIQEAYAEGNEWLGVAGKVFNMPADEEVNE